MTPADSWHATQPNEPDAPALWLAADVEMDQATSGLTPISSGVPAAQYITLVVGRAAPQVTSVTLTLPDGTTLTAPVINGDFILRQTSATLITIGQPNLTGTDAEHHTVYTSPKTAAQIPPCERTSTGIILAAPASATSSDCTTAPPW